MLEMEWYITHLILSNEVFTPLLLFSNKIISKVFQQVVETCIFRMQHIVNFIIIFFGYHMSE